MSQPPGASTCGQPRTSGRGSGCVGIVGVDGVCSGRSLSERYRWLAARRAPVRPGLAVVVVDLSRWPPHATMFGDSVPASSVRRLAAVTTPAAGDPVRLSPTRRSAQTAPISAGTPSDPINFASASRPTTRPTATNSRSSSTEVHRGHGDATGGAAARIVCRSGVMARLGRPTSGARAQPAPGGPVDLRVRARRSGWRPGHTTRSRRAKPAHRVRPTTREDRRADR
jgi:hypothetical protein